MKMRVVTGTTRPAAPSENLIWINTDVDIPWYAFTATEPTEPIEGAVWFPLNGNHDVPANIGGDNAIMIYPSGCMQYVAGAFVDMPAEIYQSGEWIALWRGVIYSPGDEWYHFTGGFVARAMKSKGSSNTAAAEPTITLNEDSMAIDSASSAGMVHTANLIDLSPFKTLTLVGEFIRGGSMSYNLMAGVWSSLGPYYVDSAEAYAGVEGTSATELAINVQGMGGSFYVGVGLTISSAVITDIYLTR